MFLKKKDSGTTETIKILDDIATLEARKNAQVAAKKISEKYKKLREANARKQKYKIPGEMVTIETVETPQGQIKVPVCIEKPKGSGKEATKKIIKKYDKIRQEKSLKKLQMQMKRRKKKYIYIYNRRHKEFCR